MKISSTYIYTMTLVVLFMFCISVSGAGAADPKAGGAKATDPKAAGQAVEQKMTGLGTAPQYKYNPAGKPDPFKPFIEEEISARKIEKAKPLAISPLQQEGVDQFKLVGISGDERGRKAIVQDVKGKVYPVFIGTYIGLNNGRVVAILSDSVIVEEKLKAPAGKTKTNRMTMKLRNGEGEGKP
jgi:type IV pilus assembly protein PilP